MPLMMQGAAPTARSAAGSPGRLDIGLVNNMPDGALAATERQFARLLAAASGEIEVRLHLFSIPEVPRGPAARRAMADRYGDVAALERTRLDGLIVTGAEPVAANLEDEPYWEPLTRVVDWAEGNTASTVWSCLAAHAAVLHLDGIRRRPLAAKRSGLYECVAVAAGGLFEGAPAGSRVPHSRWNDLAEGDLRSHGYRIASRSLDVGIDGFTKQWGSLFVFLQGHPEYEPDTLFREYRRDALRYLKRERDRLPDVPVNYFDTRTERAIAGFETRAGQERSIAAWEAFPQDWSYRSEPVALWKVTAERLYRNWLGHVAAARG